MVHYQKPSRGQSLLAGLRRGLRWTALAAVPLTLVAGIILVTPGSADPSIPQPPYTATPAAPGTAVIPMQRIDLPDPMMVAAGGRYHVYLSTAFGDRSRADVPQLVGAPGQWSVAPDALPVLPAWAAPRRRGGRVWDPYVQRIGGRYLLYFSATVLGPGRPTHCLGVARSADATGPFVPVSGPPLMCQLARGGDIDVQPFYDPGGPDGSRHPWYVIWKSDDNNLVPAQPTAIWSAPLSDDGLRVTGPGRIIFHPDLPWEHGVTEAPQMVRSPDGRVWLFFSAGRGFATADYAIGVALCDGPLGGCHDFAPAPLVATNSQGSGPGEETVFVAADHSYWLLYNPWHTGLIYMLFRPAEGVRIGWGVTGPYVAEAGSFPAPPSDTPPFARAGVR